MRWFYVYILECADKSYYTGITNNLELRIGQHNEGHNKTSYTFKRKPVVLRYSQQFHDVMQAIAFEKQVKGWSRKKKEALFKEDWEDLKRLSKNYTQFGKPDCKSEPFEDGF